MIKDEDIKYYVFEELDDGGILTEYDTFEEANIEYLQSDCATAMIKGVILK